MSNYSKQIWHFTERGLWGAITTEVGRFSGISLFFPSMGQRYAILVYCRCSIWSVLVSALDLFPLSLSLSFNSILSND